MDKATIIKMQRRLNIVLIVLVLFLSLGFLVALYELEFGSTYIEVKCSELGLNKATKCRRSVTSILNTGIYSVLTDDY